MEEGSKDDGGEEVGVDVGGRDFLGGQGDDGRVHTGDREGVYRTRTIKKKTEEEMWDPKNLEMVGGVPWKVNEEDEKADGEDSEKKLVPEDL